MNDIERNFIEGAARALWSRAWSERVGALPCAICGEPLKGHVWNGVAWSKGHGIAAQSGALPGWEAARFYHYTRTDKYRDPDAVPVTPREYELQAARLMGMIEQANGMGIAGIVEAAARADIPDDDRNCMTDPTGDCVGTAQGEPTL